LEAEFEGGIWNGEGGKEKKLKSESPRLKAEWEKMKKQMKLNCGAQRHHYSMFNVGCSMFDVQLSIRCPKPIA
jgi:hypothetical protein